MHIILTIRFDLFALFLIVILLVHIVKNYKRHGSKADRRRRKQNPQNFLSCGSRLKMPQESFPPQAKPMRHKAVSRAPKNCLFRQP